MNIKNYFSFFVDETKESIMQPQLDMSCVTKFNDDGRWYRGQIARVMDSFVDVFFVDYGNVQKTPISLVKIIDQDFLVLPPQAYKCSLDVNFSDWTNQDIERFKEDTMGKLLRAKFKPPCNIQNLKVELVEHCADGSTISINKSFEADNKRPYQQVTNKKLVFYLSTSSTFVCFTGIW